MEWKDITSRRQGDKDRTPGTWSTGISGFRIVVTRHIDHPPNVWLLRCPLFEQVLKAGNIADAKVEALATIRTHLAVISERLV